MGVDSALKVRCGQIWLLLGQQLKSVPSCCRPRDGFRGRTLKLFPVSGFCCGVPKYLRRGTQAPPNRIRVGGFKGSNPSKNTSASEAPDGVWQLIGSMGEQKMTKTTKAIMAGAAFAGLLAGTGAPGSGFKPAFFAEDVFQRAGSEPEWRQESRE
jgi:hypothetical protein